ncbi:carboxypeptidase regulatory-like domain-containing protein [Thermomicrobium sp. 4228-Ro]|uniref:putative glycoside hydrolase n=1 Tax=Thermomicrobium sp. 4228-Ro TaxID=2993937 RepID=UPI0022496FED|nr:putative glycoside hydrolase [Thermomicrobium sp. 4228-Ro]MCX2727700.1 carboxypeptidase regulatory-like domain-containing protein [Thermomicrobium sp. 4228-Ro]
MFPGNRPYRSRRRAFALSWKLSLAFIAVPLLLAALSLAYVHWLRDDRAEVLVVDRVTGAPVAGAAIETSFGTVQTNDEGQARLPREPSGPWRVAAPDYDAITFDPDLRAGRLRVLLRPNVIRGTVVRNGDGSPVAGVSVRAEVDGMTVVSARTDQQGTYVLRGVPEGATIVFEHEDYASVKVPLATDQTVVDAALKRDVLIGVLRDPQGQAVQGIVATSSGWAQAGPDGWYRLKGVAPGERLVVKAPGYRVVEATVPQSFEFDVTLEPLVVRAIYINAVVASRPEALEERLRLVDRTELNAVVIDLKDSTGHVYYDTKVSLAHEIGAVRPVLQPAELVERLKARGIYTIARIVVFEDPILAEAHPEWAIKDRTTGQAWRTWNGVAWVNAYRPEVWDYNIALAREAASFGFDEIQLDYIRFPTDGPLQKADYGVPHTAENRTAAIGEFLKRVHEALLPTQASLGADIFGLTVWELSDSGIGQHLETIVEHVDYVCSMLYPSHFWAGSLGFEIPSDHPYEVMLWSLENGLARVPAARNKFRPWLQDFSYGPGKPYGPAEVRAQIRAVYDAGLESWMLWNADNVYHEEALEPTTS